MTIRRQPEDFVVAERLTGAFRWQLRDAPPAAGDAHAVYELAKTSLTTPEAIQAIAKSLGVRAGVIDYAGLKDKHARTSQHVSVPLAPPAPTRPRVTPPTNLQGRQWSARLIGFATAGITADAIEANAFTIVVRDLSPAQAAAMDEHAGLLTLEPTASDDPAALLFTNYFGDQRFGSARHGEGFAARRLVEGDFLGALRLLIATPSRKDAGKTRDFRRLAAKHWGEWSLLAARLPRCAERGPVERLADGAQPRDAFAALPAFLQMMSVEAYQSHLWNATARRLVRDIIRGAASSRGEEGEAPYIDADDPFGTLTFAAAADVPDQWRTLELPLMGPKTELVAPWNTAAQTTLEDEGLTVDQLKIPGLRRPFFGEAPRRLFIKASNFKLTRAEPDTLSSTPTRPRLCRVASFELPKGCYATVVLRALGQ